MNGRAPHWRMLARLAIVLCGASALLGGADGVDRPMRADGLTAEVRTPITVPRPRAPFPLVVTLGWHGSTPRQGNLDVRLSDGNQTLCHWTSDPWVLGNGQRVVDVLLPPLSIDHDHDQLEIAMAWVEGDRRIALGSRVISPGGRDERTLTMGLCLPAGDGAAAQNLVSVLSLERYAPHRSDDGDGGGHSGLHTAPMRLLPEDLPEDPLAWCAFDVVVIAGERLGELKSRQVQALERWLRAGGSCCLIGAAPLPPQLAALVERARADTSGPDTSIDLGGSAGAAFSLRPGLGRLVVARGATGDGTEDRSAWRRLAAFLWQLRAEQCAALASAATWDEEAQRRARPPDESQPMMSGRSRRARAAATFATRSLDLRNHLVDQLWPEQVMAIPFSVIVTIFLAFVALVGPGDWLLLGWLRARRFTWLLFPTLAIGCTWTTVAVSRHYLGARDNVRRLELIDLGSGGRTLRRNRIELEFAGTGHTARAEIHDALWADLGSTDPNMLYTRYMGAYNAGYQDDGGGDAPASATSIHGTVSASYRVERWIPQWKPTLHRELSFAPAAPPWPLDTDAIATSDDVPSFATAWLAATGSRTVVALLQPGHTLTTFGDARILAHRGIGSAPPTIYEHDDPTAWFTALNVHPADGWFALAATVAPQGGSTYDDLAVLDPTDLTAFVVVFAQQRGDTLWMARRLLHEREPTSTRLPTP